MHPSTRDWFTVRVGPEEVEKVGDGHVLRAEPSVRVSSRAHKMSKSRGNVVNPDDVVAEYGADSLRLYEMFMGPLRDTKVTLSHHEARGSGPHIVEQTSSCYSSRISLCGTLSCTAGTQLHATVSFTSIT